MYVITDNKGIIKDISALGFSYFCLSKDNLSTNERYIDEFGISFCSELYSDGMFVNIQKKALFANQGTL